jgi:hypothetical protein
VTGDNHKDDKFLYQLISGMTKVFVGQLVDTARVVRAEWRDSDAEPLQPRRRPPGSATVALFSSRVLRPQSVTTHAAAPQTRAADGVRGARTNQARS